MTEETISRDRTLRPLVEGRGMDVRAGCAPKHAEVCWLCGTRSGGTMKEVGGRPVCVDCFRQVREVAINIDAGDVICPIREFCDLYLISREET